MRMMMKSKVHRATVTQADLHYVGSISLDQDLMDAADLLDAGAVVAIGDGANDLSMVRAAGLGFAFRAKPVLAEAADARLDHHGLDALLWAQGIPRRDWVI